jgi:hypothetical protein
MDVELTGDQLRRLRDALVQAFPSETDLAQMVRYQLDEPLKPNIGGANLNEIVFNLIEWAIARGRLEQLITGARKENSNHPALTIIANEIGQAHLIRLGQTWQQINKDLQQHLAKDNELPRLRPLLEKLHQWSSVRATKPEMLRALQPEMVSDFLELLQLMHADIEAGDSVHTVVERAYSSQGQVYCQPSWHPATRSDTGRELIQKLLEEFHQEVQSAQPNANVPIAIVVLAMRAAEVQQLADLSAFDGYPREARETFEVLKGWLAKQDRTKDWAQRYGDTPEEWRPFGVTQADLTIKSMVELAFQELNQTSTPPRKAVFENIRDLTEPQPDPQADKEHRRKLRVLRDTGALVILDTFSMHHPVLLRVLHQTALDLYPNVSIVSIAPIDDAFEKIRQMSLILQVRVADMELTKRIDDVSEGFACQEVSKARDFQKWLRDRIKATQVKRPAILEAMTSLRGQS